MTTEWRWIQRYAEQFRACGVSSGEVAVVLSETTSRPVIVETARLALEHVGAEVVDVVMTTPANPGPLPIRSTGASHALSGNPAALAALAASGFVADCTVEGLLHAPELGAVLGSGTRVLMISNEHPENTERWPHDASLVAVVDRAVDQLESGEVLSVTSAAGTDLRVNLTGAFVAGSCGFTAQPGTIAHWPGGLVVAFPAAGTVEGTLVLAPGDVNLTFKEYLRTAITLTIADDHIVDIAGDGHDAALFASYLHAFDESEALAVSHVGWGLNPHARWEAMAMWDKADHNGTELRAFAGNFLYSTGANEVAGRFCRGHVDLPMRGCTVAIDDRVVVDAGRLVDPPGTD